jgi:hypothetical protein
VRYCSTCSHIFEDDTVKFCPNDGTSLVDESALSQASFGQPLQSLAPAAVSQDIDPDFDPEITLSPGRSKIQETMLPSESLNATPQELVSAEEAPVQPSMDGKPPESNPSDPSLSGARSQAASQAGLPPSQLESDPELQSGAQPSQPQPQANLPRKVKPGRMRRVALLLIIVLAILLIPPVGAFFLWQHYKTTPAYQLALLFDAVHRNDNATVDQIVAMDTITDAFASQLTQKVLSQNTSAATDSQRKQLESSVSGRASDSKQTVREEVEKQVKDEAALTTGKSLLSIALAMYFKSGIKQSGDTATVAPQAHPVSWTMQRSSGGPWTIVAVKDDALASRIQEQITSELPSTGGEKTQNSASRQNNPTASAQQKNSTDSSRAKKKERKKPEKGFRIELPFPDLHIELRPAPRN